MVSTPQERIRSLKQLRPNFPEIEKMIIIPWFRYVDTLITSGIWNALIERTTDVTLKDNDIDSAIIITKLKKIENTHLSEAIMGHKFQTIWKNTT
jgi:3-polyprenyl-4-hydroxybenzoate decarboxylase